MNRNLNKKQPSALNKSWLTQGYVSILSLLPRWIQNEKAEDTVFNKTDFVDLKDIKEKNLLLEQYRILSEQVNKTSENRENLNNFWITLNAAIFGGISYVKDMQIDNPHPKNLFIWMLTIFGFILSVFWGQALGKIKKDIEINNEMVMEMERFLPAKIFTTSSQIKAKAQEKGSLSSTEKNIPFLFCIGYVIAAIILLIYPNIV